MSFCSDPGNRCPWRSSAKLTDECPACEAGSIPGLAALRFGLSGPGCEVLLREGLGVARPAPDRRLGVVPDECSVLDVEGVAQCSIEFCALFEVQVSDRVLGKHRFRKGHDVVARDHTHVGESFVSPHADF